MALLQHVPHDICCGGANFACMSSFAKGGEVTLCVCWLVLLLSTAAITAVSHQPCCTRHSVPVPAACGVFAPPSPLQLKLEIRPRARAAVSKVLLVGGATRMPAVQRFIRNMTGLTPVGADGGVDPDEAVALGAAVQVSRSGRRGRGR
jgi:hypothetical protein